eukprot:TRINITY_DN2737_c0_g1_i2.p1 TRINITY_DN2737_c0_g1~~TRINITY_DN2737_c0_g1_i2.p1  ORF type:complete len:183 (-),score=22.34 TRINITY_DN2737_c0_g1_i2:1197-1745(-)
MATYSGYGTVQESRQPEYRTYSRRWYILLQSCCLSCTQCIVWATFSPVADSTKKYFNTNDTILNMWLAIGCIVYIPSVFVAGAILNRKVFYSCHPSPPFCPTTKGWSSYLLPSWLVFSNSCFFWKVLGIVLPKGVVCTVDYKSLPGIEWIRRNIGSLQSIKIKCSVVSSKSKSNCNCLKSDL